MFNKIKTLKTAATAALITAVASPLAMAQTTPIGDMVDGAVDQIEPIGQAMVPLFLAGVGLAAIFVVYKKVRSGVAKA